MKNEMDFINGVEEGQDIYKRLANLTAPERETLFGTAIILDVIKKFDVFDIADRLNEHKLNKIKLRKMFVIRAIKDEGTRKTVVKEERMQERPCESEIKFFLIKNPDASFAVVEEIYVIGQEE